MASEESFTTETRPSRSDLALGALLAGAGFLLYLRPDAFGEPRRAVLALAAMGVLFASPSPRPLRLAAWLAGVAVVGWAGRLVASGLGGPAAWIACAAGGAALAIRGGGRFAFHYLPEASTEDGLRLQRSIRRNLQVAGLVFLVPFLGDGLGAVPASWRFLRPVALAFAAAFFLRFFLLQSKHLKLAPRAIEPVGLVPSQRWPVLAVMAAVVATPLSEWVPGPGQEGALVLAASLLLVLSAVVAALALPRMAWPRPAIRRAAFGLGIGLAVALAAVVVELERWGPHRFTSFQTLCTVALLVVPFADATTGVLSDHPRLAGLTPPIAVSILVYPASVMNGWRWSLASTGFLFAFVTLALVYQLVVALREGRSGKLYLSASLAVLAAGLASAGEVDPERGAAWNLALLAFGFVLWSVDLYDRAGHVARARTQ